MENQKVRQLAIEVASHLRAMLQETWEIAPLDGDRVASMIKGPSDCGIYLRESRSGRVEISGVWPRSKTGNIYAASDCYGADGKRLSNPSITVAGDKAPQGIARDIVRRFLPDYRTAFEAARKRAQADNDYQALALANYDRLFEVFGDAHNQRAKFERGGCFSVSVYPPQFDGVYRIEVTGSGVRFELRDIPVERAIEVLRLLKKLSGGASDASENV